MPELSDIYPNSVGWVAGVLVIGANIALVAAYGYKMATAVAEPTTASAYGLPGRSMIERS
jgi:hypothetical protein